MAKERSELAVIAALAPVCADKFRALPDAEADLVALSKVDSWKRGDEFPKEFVLCRVIRTLVPRLWTRVPSCCLHRSQLRSNDITATERKFFRRFAGLLSERGPASVCRPEIPASKMRLAD